MKNNDFKKLNFEYPEKESKNDEQIIELHFAENNTINLIEEEFKTIIKECNKEEKNISRLIEKLRTLKLQAQKNNKKRLELLNKIRNDKIEEVDKELEKAKKVYNGLETEIGNIKKEYCQRNGHSMKLISRKYLGDTGKHSFKHGFEMIYDLKYECQICGAQNSYTSTGYLVNSTNEFKHITPEDLKDDKSLSKSGKSYNELLKELEELKNYIEYLKSLYRGICNIFGHDLQLVGWDEEIYECKCCKLRGSLYGDRSHGKIHRGIYNIADNILRSSYDGWNRIVNVDTKNMKFNLPSYNEYKKTLKKIETK